MSTAPQQVDLSATLPLDASVIDDPYSFYRRLVAEASVWRVPGTARRAPGTISFPTLRRVGQRDLVEGPFVPCFALCAQEQNIQEIVPDRGDVLELGPLEVAQHAGGRLGDLRARQRSQGGDAVDAAAKRDRGTES